MLKRYQILLNDWLANHYKDAAKKNDVSFSEMIRMALCNDLLQAAGHAFPKHRVKIDRRKIAAIMKAQQLKEAMHDVEFHKLLSQIYFESRKAAELWNTNKPDAD